MSTLKEVLKLHTDILASVGCHADADGKVFVTETMVPCCADQKQYHLPTQESMRSGGGEDYITYYLLSESISATESQVLQKVRSLMNARLSTAMAEAICHFISLADADHSTLTPKQKEVLKYVKDADATTMENFEKICGNISFKGQRLFVKMFQKFQGSIRGDKFSRTCNVAFPILDDLENAPENKNKVFGITCRVKDIRIYTDLFYYLLGSEAGEDGFYSRGSNDLTAPYFVSLARSFIAIADSINAKLKRYGLPVIPIDYRDELETLASLRGIVPAGLPGTEGVIEGKRIQQTRPVLGFENEIHNGGTSAAAPQQTTTQVIETGRPATNTAATATSSGYRKYDPNATVQQPVVIQAAAQQPAVQQTRPVVAGAKVSWEEAKARKQQEMAQFHQQQQVGQVVYQQAAPQVIYQTQPVHQVVQQQQVYQNVQIGVDGAGRPVFRQMLVNVPVNTTVPFNVHQNTLAVQNNQLAAHTDPNEYFRTINNVSAAPAPVMYHSHGGAAQTYYNQNTYQPNTYQPTGYAPAAARTSGNNVYGTTHYSSPAPSIVTNTGNTPYYG